MMHYNYAVNVHKCKQMIHYKSDRPVEERIHMTPAQVVSLVLINLRLSVVSPLHLHGMQAHPKGHNTQIQTSTSIFQIH